MKKVVFRSFTKFTGKHLCQSLRSATLLKKETLPGAFSCEFCDISKKTFLQKTTRLKKKFCKFKIHLFSILNTKQTNYGIFSNKAGENFNLAKIFLNVRVRL